MPNREVTIIGAGLCGSLLAILLAQRGYKISMYEKRADMREIDIDGHRSINLALSNRGLKALDLVGLTGAVSPLCTPMLGRMIHTQGMEARLSNYSGRKDDYINSISRSELNKILLSKADEYDHVDIMFNCPCDTIDFDHKVIHFDTSRSNQISRRPYDILFGTDGAGSAVRKNIIDHLTPVQSTFYTDYLSHGYKELTMYPKDNDWQLYKNALHIWPRTDFMIIALPNSDKSFTVTAFMPLEGVNSFDAIESKESVGEFFHRYFSELTDCIPQYLEEFINNPTGVLGTVKGSPWHLDDSVLLLGDAAHAIVPFYGQGMNASFEDISVLDSLLLEHGEQLDHVIRIYSDYRKSNTDAIADLAIDNFLEMQDKVDDRTFIAKRSLEMELEKNYKDYYSKYSLVTFNSDIPYSDAMKIGRAQDKFLLNICSSPNYEQLSIDQIYLLLKDEIYSSISLSHEYSK